MADPFSIIAGTASLFDICWRIVSYLKQVQEAAGRVEEEIAALLHEIEALISVNESLGDVWATERKAYPGTSLADSGRVDSLWRNAGTILQDCRAIVEKLEFLVKEIIGKEGPKITGKFDGIKKLLRKQSKDEEFNQLRHQLTNYQNSLQVLLTALNLSYTRSSQDSTDLSLGHLSENVQLLGFKLQTQIASLRSRLVSTDGSNLRDSISSAAAVASLLSPNKHFHVPQTVSSIFTGREALLEELKSSFDAPSPEHNHTQKRFVIYGLGGSGKTQFCCKFAQDNRQNFWGIFWIDASSHESAKHKFARISQIGGVEPNERAAKNWLSNLERPWLLLIDNADDPRISVDDYFPEGERGFILVTTRNPSNKVHGTIGSRFYHFEKLESGEANDLLLKAACEPSPWSFSTRKSAAAITEALGFLPLALIHAGRAIMNRLCSLGNYLDFYERNWQRIRRARRVSGFHGDENTNMNVYSSYEIIYQGLEATRTEESEDAIELLKMFSFLYCENIRVDILIMAATNPRLEQEQQEKKKKEKETMKTVSKPKSWIQFLNELGFEILKALLKDRSRPVLPAVLRDIEPLDDLRLRVALKELTQMSLITHHETIDSYSMHPLVHTWIRERPQMSTGEQAIWCEAATTTLAQCILLPPLGSTEADEDLRRDLLPHVIHVQKCQEEIRARISENQKIRKRPWPVLALRLDGRQALQLAKFSLVYSQCGLWNEAEKLQLAVKNFVCRTLGMEDPAAMDILLALSGTYWQQARTNEAAVLQNQVLQACMNSLGPDHPKTLKVMDTLGASRCFQGRFKEALELHEKAIEGMTKTLGADHESTLLALDNLGRVMWRYFRYDEAKDLHSKAVAGMKKVLGPTHLNTLTAMESLAMTYLKIGGELLSPAHDLMIQVLEQRKKKLGKEQPYTLLAISNLARIKSALNQTAEAEKLMLLALPIAERNLGENHFGTLAGRVHFAQVLVRQGRYSEAEDIFTNVIQRQRYATAARDDGEHPDRILAMYYLLQCYQLQGKIEDAIRICDELSEGVRTIGGQGLGSVHPFAQQLLDKRSELEAARSAPAVELLANS